MAEIINTCEKESLIREAAKNSSSFNGRAIKRGRGGKGPAINEKITFSMAIKPEGEGLRP